MKNCNFEVLGGLLKNPIVVAAVNSKKSEEIF